MKPTDQINQLSSVSKEKSEGQLLEEFAYAVSHNLSAPSRHINRYLDMLENELEAEPYPLGERSREVLNRLSKAHEKLEQHMAAILDFSRAGREIPNFKELNIGAFMETQIETFEEQIAFQYLPPKQRIAVPTDAFMLEEIIHELFKNAIQFSKTDQQTEIILYIGANDQEAFIEIKDHGLGFDMKSKNRLFLLFQSLHSKQETDHNGLGAGLAIISRTALQLGIRIVADAQRDQGACFTVFIPIKPPETKELPSFLQF